MEQQQPCAPQPVQAAGATLPAADLSALRPPHFPEKKYHGRRGRDGSPEVWVEECRNTPTGTEMTRPFAHCRCTSKCAITARRALPGGYDGSGPAQLALALLIDATGNEAIALRHYQESKRQFVAGWKDS